MVRCLSAFDSGAASSNQPVSSSRPPSLISSAAARPALQQGRRGGGFSAPIMHVGVLYLPWDHPPVVAMRRDYVLQAISIKISNPIIAVEMLHWLELLFFWFWNFD